MGGSESQSHRYICSCTTLLLFQAIDSVLHSNRILHLLPTSGDGSESQSMGKYPRVSSSLQQGQKIALVSVLPASGPSGPPFYVNKIIMLSEDRVCCRAEPATTAISSRYMERKRLVWRFQICKFLLCLLSRVPKIAIDPQVIQTDKLWKVS